MSSSSSNSVSKNNKKRKISYDSPLDVGSVDYKKQKFSSTFWNKSQKETIKKIKNREIDPNSQDQRGNTFFHHLCLFGSSVMIGKLFDTGVKIDMTIKNNHGLTGEQILSVIISHYEEGLENIRSQNVIDFCERTKVKTAHMAKEIIEKYKMNNNNDNNNNDKKVNTFHNVSIGKIEVKNGLGSLNLPKNEPTNITINF